MFKNEAVDSDLLKDPNLDVGKATAIDESKKDTSASLFGYGTSLVGSETPGKYSTTGI